MDYLKTNLKWADYFIQESIELEEKHSSFDLDSLTKSKLRLSLENNILNWDKYEAWILEHFGCTSLKKETTEATLKNFSTNAKLAYDVYSNYDFWSEDLMPIFIWENKLVVFGLEYNENLIKIENHIFILAPPEALNYFHSILFNQENLNSEIENLEKSYSKTDSKIEGLDINSQFKPSTLNFKNVTTDTATSSMLSTEFTTTGININENTIWEFINERHEENCFEVKKQFSSYVVLRISHSSTKVFKMDQSLVDQGINEKLFTYDLNENNPFKSVYETGISESFSVSQLGLDILDFKYACITALKRNNIVVGFLVGLKNKSLSEDDQTLLEELAKESAA